MTPIELQALLDREGVPMEARALLYIHNEYWFVYSQSIRRVVSPHLAELAHVGAMVRWLADEGVAPEIERYSILNGSKFYCVYYDHKYCERAEFDDATTLTEALAHACGRIAKEKADPMNCPKCTTRTVISGNAKVCLNCGWKEKDNA